jgi:general secretion pathway protein C
MSTTRTYIVVWSLTLGSALPWAYLLTHPSKPAAANPPAGLPSAAITSDLTRLLGADPPPIPVEIEAPPLADVRMQLIGVVSAASDGDADEGLALIAINGQPAKVFRVGMVVDGETVLQAVEARGARLGPQGGATLISLRTTPLSEVATPDRQQPGAPAGASMAMPLRMPLPAPVAPPSVPPPTTLPAPSTDGAPPPFGGPPQALGGAPPAQVQPLPRRGVTR